MEHSEKRSHFDTPEIQCVTLSDPALFAKSAGLYRRATTGFRALSVTRFSLVLFLVLFALTACKREYKQNPDPNHTHADFAVWVENEQVDFSGDEYMSGLEDDHEHEHEHLHDYLHMHDNIGGLVHRHKLGLSLREFFGSLGFKFDSRSWRMFVNEAEEPFDLEYIFQDMDKIIITDSVIELEVASQLMGIKDDACRYSRTCPWRGDPPAENCIADPAVPCTVPEDQL